MLKRKKRSLFIYLLGKKGRQIYKTLTIKNAKGKKTREILLREPDLTLTQCIDRCRAAEQSKIQSQKIENYEKLNVDDDTYEKDINATGRKKQYDCIYCQRSHEKI